MKVWEEDEVLEALMAARAATEESGPSTVSFLLLLARKYQRKHYEFVYYPAGTYERIEELFDATAVVLEDGTITSSDDGESDDAMVWIGHPSSDEEDDDDDDNNSPFESFYCGKAIFHTASGEPLMKLEGSPGWREALQQKYHALDAKSRAATETEEEQRKRNRTAAKAVAAAALGTGVATGGTSLAAGAMGYTASGIAANSVAATIMSAEAVASGGGVAAGGFTATMQTIGAVGVMASPVGVTLAAGGAIVGLGGYYWMHRRNRRRREEQKAKELAENGGQSNKMDEAASEEEEDEEEMNQYQPLCDDDTEHHHEENNKAVEFWVMVAAKRIDMEESEHCYDHAAWEEQVDADKAFQEVSSNTSAKALFDPHGVLYQVYADPADKDGWEMALRLHYTYLVEHDMIPTTREKHGEGATEDTPLLTPEE
ncbi:interferon, alpha-inducible protein 27-like [Seminavis robusta]|uniref:Interferon, alpha-inducible protein 27-like n=1 Tax=Seminavis robusta TaxID=568900 RepID=A0A9N8EA65_9STRA|nr:interferon, alpha-inducible protein 27-like [Seminavis robusta]|eukprot:Sro796_g203680.1 interferon, alpha-inducible protein 27-like (428) ;mRNA; r:9933-11216